MPPPRLRTIRMTGNLSLPESGGASAVWPRAGLALESTMLATAAGAGLLTAGTLIFLKAGTQRLIDPSSAARAWLVCVGLAGLSRGRSVAPHPGRHGHASPTPGDPAACGRDGLDAPGPGAAVPARRRRADRAVLFANSAWEGWPAASLIDTDVSTARIRERWNGRPPTAIQRPLDGFFGHRTAGPLPLRHDLRRWLTALHRRPARRRQQRSALECHAIGRNPARAGSPPRAARVCPVRRRLRDERGRGRAPAGAIAACPRGRCPAARPATARCSPPGSSTPRSRPSPLPSRSPRLIMCGSASRVRAFARALAPARASVAQSYRNRPALVFSVLIFVATLLMPWPGGTDGWILVKSVATTIRDLNRGTGRAGGRISDVSGQPQRAPGRVRMSRFQRASGK